MSRGNTSPGTLFVNVLGGFQAAGPGPTDILLLERKKTRALLAMLALNPGQCLPRGKITTLLWSEQSEEAARHALRQCLLDLRQVLAKAKIEAIRTQADSVGLEPSRVVVDAAGFERYVAHGSADALQEAVALYRGDFLEGFNVEEPAFENWLRLERDRLRSQAVGALKNLLAHYARKKGSGAAVQVAVRLLALEPFDETVHRALMRLYAESGCRSAALRQYEDCVEILGRELGVEPEAETRETYRRLVTERARSSNVPAAARTPRTRTASTLKAQDPFRSLAQTPLVGRNIDLEWLDGFTQQAYHGQARLLLVIGEAGIGKSRFVAELAARTRQPRAGMLLGRGREGESVLPFAPWVEALRPALGEDCLRHLPPTIRRDLARLFPEIEDGPSPPLGGLEDGPRIFEAVAHLLRQLAGGRPRLVIIEDLHWCDDMTVRLLKFLPRRLDGQPVLLLGTARPEEMGVDAGQRTALDTLARDPACVSRTLGPLSRDETTRLLRALLTSRDDAPPAALAERTWRLSEGNPFVVVECARALRDRGSIGADVSFDLPDQVRALTARCFASLGDHATRLADVAAVIGRDFDVLVLRHAIKLAEQEIADGIEELVRRHVLREVDGRFDFVHDRIREVAYARLLSPRRMLLHRQVAEALEAVYAHDTDSYCAAIGSHYREAGDWDRASTYLARAGFQAWERGAGREALACFEDGLQAIARLADSPERRELHVHLGLAANGASVASGSYERGRRHLHTVARLTTTLSNRRWHGLVAIALSNSYRAAGALDDALRFGQQALDVALEIGDLGLQSVARYVLGQADNTAGNLRRSLVHLTALLNDDAQVPNLAGPLISQVDRLQSLRVAVRYSMMLNYVQLGEFQAGRRLLEEWLPEIDSVSDPLGTARLMAHLQTGRLSLGVGDFDGAVRSYEAARATYREDCQRVYSRPLTWGLGLAYALAGRISEALELFERHERLEAEIGSKGHNHIRLLFHGLALVKAMRIDDATRFAQEARRLAAAGSSRLGEAGAHRILGEVASLQDPVDEKAMESHFQAALTLAQELEMRPLAGRCHLGLAWLYEKQGRVEHDEHSAAASLLLQEMGNPRSLDAAGVI